VGPDTQLSGNPTNQDLAHLVGSWKGQPRLSVSDAAVAALIPRKPTVLVWPEALCHREWIALVKPRGESKIISVVLALYLAERAFVWTAQNVSVLLACVEELSAFYLLSDFVDYIHTNIHL
jgi:hypothetical protein